MKAPSPLSFRILLGFVLLSQPSLAQSDEVLTARPAKNTVFAEIDESAKCLRFMSNTRDTDKLKWDYAIKEPDPLMLISDNTYNLHLRSTNPLKYRIEREGQQYEEDQYDKTLNALADNVQTLLTIISSGNITTGSLVSGNELRQGPSAFDGGKAVTVRGQDISLTSAITGTEVAPKSTGKGKAELEGVRDYGVRRSIMLLRQITGKKSWGSSAPDIMVRVVIDSVKAIEENANMDMIAEATNIIKKLVEVDLSTSTAEAAISELQVLIGQLKQKNDALVGRLNNLGGLEKVIAAKAKIEDQERASADKKELEDRIDEFVHEWGMSKEEATFWAEDTLRYSEFPPWYKTISVDQRFHGVQLVELAVEEFTERMTRFVNQRKVLVTNLTELWNQVSTAQKANSKTEHGTERIYSETIPKGKTELVTISVKQRSFKVQSNYSVTVDEAPLFTHKLKFMRAHTFYPQAFPGLVFINSIYPEFTAEEDSLGVQRVRSKDNTQGYVNIAGMVNFNIKMDRRTEVPFLQLGVSTKKSRPQVFVGTGIRFTEWFCVSIGAAMTWEGTLKELSIGDKVANQDAIEKDLKYTMSDPKFYFGIQLRPSTITKKP